MASGVCRSDEEKKQPQREDEEMVAVAHSAPTDGGMEKGRVWCGVEGRPR